MLTYFLDYMTTNFVNVTINGNEYSVILQGECGITVISGESLVHDQATVSGYRMEFSDGLETSEERARA